MHRRLNEQRRTIEHTRVFAYITLRRNADGYVYRAGYRLYESRWPTRDTQEKRTALLGSTFPPGQCFESVSTRCSLQRLPLPGHHSARQPYVPGPSPEFLLRANLPSWLPWRLRLLGSLVEVLVSAPVLVSDVWPTCAAVSRPQEDRIAQELWRPRRSAYDLPLSENFRPQVYPCSRNHNARHPLSSISRHEGYFENVGIVQFWTDAISAQRYRVAMKLLNVVPALIVVLVVAVLSFMRGTIFVP
jgi:hypothetical protein